jgi:effector-binding domain-containing protein
MLDAPQIVQTTRQLTAVIRLTIPREEIQSVMGPAIAEVRAAVAAQGLTPTGPWFSHHFRMHPAVFDFEVGVPMSTSVAAAGRVTAGILPAARVARTIYHGSYEGLPDAWGELETWIEVEGHTSRPDLWERYVVGPETSHDPMTWCTELNRPLND